MRWARCTTSGRTSTPDILAALPVVPLGDGEYGFGAFVVNPARRSYHADVGLGDAPEVYSYSGDVRWTDGGWVASEPRVLRAHQVRPE